MEEVEITEKAIFLYASHMLGRTPKKSTVVSKKAFRPSIKEFMHNMCHFGISNQRILQQELSEDYFRFYGVQL